MRKAPIYDGTESAWISAEDREPLELIRRKVFTKERERSFFCMLPFYYRVSRKGIPFRGIYC